MAVEVEFVIQGVSAFVSNDVVEFAGVKVNNIDFGEATSLSGSIYLQLSLNYLISKK